MQFNIRLVTKLITK